jgi:hypothetical protein
MTHSRPPVALSLSRRDRLPWLVRAAAGLPAGRARLGSKPGAAIAAELDTAALGCGQRRLGASGNHTGFELGNRGHLLQQEFAGGALDQWQIGETNVYTGFEQPGEEGYRAGEPVPPGSSMAADGKRGQIDF